MVNDLDENIARYRAEIEQLQQSLWQRPGEAKKIRLEIEQLQKTICQTVARAGRLLNKSKLVNGAGTVVACVRPTDGGFHVYRRTRRFSRGIEFDFVNVGLVLSAEEIKSLATRLASDMSITHITNSDWRRIADALGKNTQSTSSKGKHQRSSGISLANFLLEQISSDFDPHHFTLAELQAEYASVSSTEGGTPIHYDTCLQMLEEAGHIVKNRDGSYRVCK
jgi:regulator of replication initiation timing